MNHINGMSFSAPPLKTFNKSMEEMRSHTKPKNVPEEITISDSDDDKAQGKP